MADPLFQVPLEDGDGTVLYAERLRDGRIAIGTRAGERDGEERLGELHLLGPRASLALAGWLADSVEQGWLATVRERQTDQLRTAWDLYGDGPAAIEQLGREMLSEVPPSLLLRALALLANAIGPAARERLVAQLNHTRDAAEEDALRRRLAQERDALAYTVAAAALFDALDRGITSPEDLDSMQTREPERPSGGGR